MTSRFKEGPAGTAPPSDLFSVTENPHQFQRRAGAFFVWVSKESKATRRQVGIGVRTPGYVEVKSGVEAGEQVVVGGQERLFEGAALAPTVVDRTPTPKVEGD